MTAPYGTPGKRPMPPDTENAVLLKQERGKWLHFPLFLSVPGTDRWESALSRWQGAFLSVWLSAYCENGLCPDAVNADRGQRGVNEWVRRRKKAYGGEKTGIQ